MEKLFFFNTENLVAQHGDGNGHQGREDVEKAIGQVGERRDMQDERLGHTAGVPWHEHRGDGGGILRRAAEQASLEALLFVELLEDVAREDDAEVLVAGNHVGREAGADGSGDQRTTAADTFGQRRGEALYHAGTRHRPAESRGAEDKEDRREHTSHAARLHQAAERFVAHVERRAAVVGQHQPAETVVTAHMRDDIRLGE